MRIDADLIKEDRKKVKQRADKRRLKITRAYAVLIRKALEYENSKGN